MVGRFIRILRHEIGNPRSVHEIVEKVLDVGEIAVFRIRVAFQAPDQNRDDILRAVRPEFITRQIGAPAEDVARLPDRPLCVGGGERIVSDAPIKAERIKAEHLESPAPQIARGLLVEGARRVGDDDRRPIQPENVRDDEAARLPASGRRHHEAVPEAVARRKARLVAIEHQAGIAGVQEFPPFARAEKPGAGAPETEGFGEEEP